MNTLKVVEVEPYALSVEKAAEFVGTSVHTLKFWVRKGYIASYKPAGRLLFKLDDLKRFVDSGKQ